MLNAKPANAHAVNAAGSSRYVRLGASSVQARAITTSTLTRMRGFRALVQARALIRTARLRRLRRLTAQVAARSLTTSRLRRRVGLSSAATPRALQTSHLRPMRGLQSSVIAAALQSSDLGVNPHIIHLSSTVTAAAISSGALGAIKRLQSQVLAEAIQTSELSGFIHVRLGLGVGKAEAIEQSELSAYRHTPLFGSFVTAAAIADANLPVVRPLVAVPATARATVKSAALYRLVPLGSSYAVARAIAFGGLLLSIVTDREPPYRTVSIINDDSTLRMRTFQRQPGDYLPYDIDLEQWLTPFPGDGIESVEILVTEGTGPGATIDDLDIDRIDFVVPVMQEPPLPAIRAKAWVRGGVSGGLYKITARLTTIGDRVKEVDFRISVNEV